MNKLIFLCLAFLLATGCGKNLSETGLTEDPLTQKPGYDHENKLTLRLSDAQRFDFYNFTKDTGRIEAAAQLVGTTLPGSQPQSSDSRIQQVAVRMTKCAVHPVDTSVFDSSNFEVSLTASGDNCPVLLNVKFTTAKSSGALHYNFYSRLQVPDKALQMASDVSDQNITGSGESTWSGTTQSLTQDIRFDAAGTLISKTRGAIQLIRTVRAQILTENGVARGIHSEIAVEFSFPAYKVLLQQVTFKNGFNPPQVNYYLNGASIGEDEYKGLVNPLGIQTQMISKL